jgi:hypothetical protein
MSVQEETIEAINLVNFPRVYVPPRKSTIKQVRIQKETKYDMVTPMIPPSVTIEGELLHAIQKLRYSNHNLADLEKFPELAPQNYLCIGMNPRSLVITVELKDWALGLQ